MIKIFANKQALSEAGAELFLTVAQEAVEKNGRFLVALSGGSTPAILYELLGKRPFLDTLPWQKTHIFWGDERLVPPDDDGSNYKQAHDLFLQHIPIPLENIHRAKGELSPKEAAADYIQQLKAFSDDSLPTFDLILLGLGNDGHTASLFPGPITTAEQQNPVISVTATYEGRPANRITFTPKLINKAHHILVLATGKSKSDLITKVLYGPLHIERFPIQRIKPNAGQLLWYLDKEAGSFIRSA